MSRRVLMICYHYHPSRSSGSARNTGFARELSRLGWQPVVLTATKAAKNDERNRNSTVGSDVAVVRTFEWGLGSFVDFLHGAARRIWRRLGMDLKRNYFREAFCVPDEHISWFSTWHACRTGRHCDIIYASCFPFSSSLSACVASLVNRKPLVLDFRDAWTLSPYRDRIPPHRWLAKRLEKWVLDKCDILILNSDGAKELYVEEYPQHADKLIVIPNGYDSLNLSSYVESEKFTVMHVGRFYAPRTPMCLLKAIEKIGNPAIEFVQVGPCFGEYKQFSNRIPIRLIGPVDRQKALDLMRTASLLYLCQGFKEGISRYPPIAGKTYEYLSTGIPILADCPEGDNAEFVRRYANTSYVVTSNDVDEMTAAVESAFAARHAVKRKVNAEFARLYSRETLTRRLCEVFSFAQTSFERKNRSVDNGV